MSGSEKREIQDSDGRIWIWTQIEMVVIERESNYGAERAPETRNDCIWW